jgi:hypothetical protein
MRNFHRWLATLGMLFFLYMGVTGTLVQITEINTGPTLIGEGGENVGAPEGPMPGTSPGALPGPDAAQAGPPGMPPMEMTGLAYWRQTFKGVHGGGVGGLTGQWVVFGFGISLFIMAITGLILYFQLLGQRKKTGKEDWFWR